MPPGSIGTDEMPWTEAVMHARILRSDPSSAIAAALEGWDNPISREALVLMDLFDLDHAVAAGKKKPAPHPGRPFSMDASKKKRRGNTEGRSVAEVKAILAGFGHPPV